MTVGVQPLPYSVLNSHCWRVNYVLLSLVERFIVLLLQHSYAIKNQRKTINASIRKHFIGVVGALGALSWFFMA